MAVETPVCTFAAPPKSGCRYVCGILRQAGPVADNGRHVPVKLTGLPLISVVRNPADWLRSYFQNINSPIWPPVDVFLAYRGRSPEQTPDGLRRFVEAYLSGPSGTIGEMFAAYRPDKVWRIEDMPGPLGTFLGITPQDAGRNETRRKIEMPDDLRQAVLSHEKAFVRQWGYEIEIQETVTC